MDGARSFSRRVFYRFALGAALLFGAHLMTFSPHAMLAVLVFGVAILGIPHGAFDHVIGRRLLRGGVLRGDHSQSVLALSLFLLAYVSLSALFMVGWVLMPALGLFVFLVMSAAHFGTDWRDTLPMSLRLVWGTLVIATPFYAHPRDVEDILHALLVSDATPFINAAPVAFWGALAVALFRLRPLLEKRHVMASLGLLLATGTVFHPLVYFACYFCACHSPIHFQEIRHALKIRTSGQVLRMAGPIVLATWGAASVGYALMAEYSVASPLLKMTFIGLACLTVPHIIVEWLDHRKALAAATLAPE
ncbi:Brp/Blh family beta-carotene 15,15'-dioxygenase [Larsenimonas suaedae]|uniref:Probable beta-carotene 15,15'-dioxygenase n=1 Tax=Larsenimonas suaedae TaxID=1851019 RepID=A0ABU1GW87_9GAMM|nr:Brp/Blh family beta-carotene 15,15'-dioxygenase [Larsenimonas suaedae]MCM2973424.1 Brp/Blh family beta-carotene 15,15'-dioxygenase [Larsenimonas suaedae]MDR5896317.1 Brp/Blh family beta-carotene 15,15'-dioxygenase [Larsenimonas suaedae]